MAQGRVPSPTIFFSPCEFDYVVFIPGKSFALIRDLSFPEKDCHILTRERDWTVEFEFEKFFYKFEFVSRRTRYCRKDIS